MEQQEILDLFIKAGAIRQGHYYRLSGRHTDWYVQCARLFEDTGTAALLGSELAARSEKYQAGIVLAAAVGGILPGFETARALGLRLIYCEKRDGALILRRGFELPQGARVLIIEDEVSTGQSVREMSEIVHALKGEVAGISCLVDKSGGRVHFDAPFESLLTLKAEHYRPETCPMCAQGMKLENAG